MKVLVSACLLGEGCRFDGRSKPSQDVIDFLEGREAVRVCPEVMGGLHVPHPPCEIAQGHACPGLEGMRVSDDTGADNTEAFCKGAEAVARLARESGCTHAIMKAKSPSCGVGEVYSGNFSGTLVEGNGIAARLLISQGLVVATEKDFREVFGIGG